MIRFTKPPAPRRPVSVELAAGIAFGEVLFILVLVFFGGTPTGPVDPSAFAEPVALQLIALVVAILLRSGRAWILCLNVSAVYAFLYFAQVPDPAWVLLSFGQLYIVAALYYRRNHDWFDAMRIWRATPGTVVQPDDADEDGPAADEERGADAADARR
jgi:hypothetical protein